MAGERRPVRGADAGRRLLHRGPALGAAVLSGSRRAALGLAAALCWAAVAHAQEPAVEPPAPAVGAGEAAAPVVRRLELRSDTPLADAGEVLDLLALEPGEPLSEARVRRTLRNLHASGLAAEAEVWSEAAPEGGVVAIVVLRGTVLVEEVHLSGTLGLRREALRREVLQAAGQPLVEDRVLRSVFRLQDRYRSEGYLEAGVRARVDVDEVRRRATVDFVIESGPRARVGEVDIAGDLGPFAAHELRPRLELAPQASYRQTVGREAVDRLELWLQGAGYLQAEVELVAEDYDASDATVDLDYTVAVGPRVEVVVVGADREALEKQGLLPFLGPEGYDEVLVLQALERIERAYQQRGHYRVAVRRREERTEQVLRLVLEVEPGPAFTLEEIAIEGNEEIADDRVRQLMTTSERRLLVAGSGRLVDQVLEEDLENVRSFYALAGFLRARVGPARVEELGAGRLRLVVPIAEGPRTRLVRLTVEGAREVPEDALITGLPLEPGGPFHPRLLDESLDRIRSRYELRGYASARVSASTDWNEDRTLVDVAVNVLEGPRQLLGHLIVRGNRTTETAAIRRFTGATAGEPLSRRRLLEIQRNLYRLGIFSRVDVELAPAGEEVGVRDVVIRVEEGRNQRVAYGLGYDSEEGVGGLLGYSHGNLWGSATRLQIDLRASERTERYRLLLSRPYRRGGSEPGAVTMLLFNEGEQRASFALDKHGVQVELARGDERQRLSLFTDYRLVDLEIAEGLDPEDLDLPPGQTIRDIQDVKIFSLVPRAVWDRRDDPLDPSRGHLSTLQLQYAVPVGDIADQHFVKLFGQHARYFPLELGVLALSLRAGAIEPRGDEPVALSELFYAGGRTTHRAYERDRLGIRGETLDPDSSLPLGGRGLLLVNLDWRFPIVGTFGGTVFADAGNVWERWDAVRLEDVATGAGLGVRWLSPLGPLRLEMGWKLDRQPGESPYEVFLSFGNAF